MDAKARFQWVRNHYNLSMSAFGKKIGLSASGVSAIEYGTRNMNDKHIKLICAAFPAINEDWLRTGNGEPEIEPVSDEVADFIQAMCVSEIDLEIMQGIVSLNPEQKNAVIQIIKGLSNSNK